MATGGNRTQGAASGRGQVCHRLLPVLLGFLELLIFGCVKFVPEILSVSVASSLA